MKTAEEIAQKAYTGGDPDIEDIVAVMKEYAREQLTDVQRMLQGNDIDGIGEYIKKLKDQL